jgi:hypothetical protein
MGFITGLELLSALLIIFSLPQNLKNQNNAQSVSESYGILSLF